MRRKISSALALFALAGCSASSIASGPEATPTLPQPQRAPVVMVLGDSYTAGTGFTIPEQTYAGALARRLGWQVIIGGHGGTGFVVRGRVGKDFATLFADQLAWRPAPDMVMIVGGHNDAAKLRSVLGIDEAVTGLLGTVKARWPRVPVVLVGPMWGGDPTVGALAVRDVMAVAAGRLRVPFVDPLQEQWITGDVSLGTGNAPLYIRRDEVHPNPAGNAYFADRLFTALAKLGLDQPGRRTRR